MDHVSSPLVGLLFDDSRLVVVDLSSSPFDVGPPICTPPRNSSIVVGQSAGTPSSSNPSSQLDVSSIPLSLDEVINNLYVLPGDGSPFGDT